MKKRKIVADSSSDVLALDGVDFASAPLKITTSEREFIDNAALNVEEMVSYLGGYRGRSKTSCPNVGDWLAAFGDAEEIVCITITSGLSGSYNAACSAKEAYESEHPDRRVFVLDTLSAGPEIRLIIERLTELLKDENDFDAVCRSISDYCHTTGLCFMLKSLKNFANNGRVSPVVAKIAGLVGICIIGKASSEGTLEPTDKCRGELKSIETLARHIYDGGLRRGKAFISHCQNELGAGQLAERIATLCPGADIRIFPCRGLCSFYAEKGGILVGFEKH